MKTRLQLAMIACRWAGMEAHYPPAAEPATERAPSKVKDGTPCTGYPIEPRRYVNPRS
jgi:hypothetical protein